MINNFMLNCLYISFSNRCNFKCKYCYVEKQDEEQTYLMTEDGLNKLINFIDTIPKSSTYFHIIIFGGEPLLYKDILLSFIKKINNKYHIAIFSNGSLLTDKFLDDIKLYNVTVNISLDGNKVMNDLARVFPNEDSTYDIVKNKISLLLNKSNFTNVNFKCKQTISLENYSEVFNTYKEVIDGRFLNKVELSASFNRSVIWPAEDLQQYKTLLFKLSDYYIEHFNPNIKIDLFTMPLNTIYRGYECDFCNAGNFILGINSDGIIYPCPHFFSLPNYVLGHIEYGINQELLQIYRSKIPHKIDAICNHTSCIIPNHKCEGICLSAYLEDNNIAPSLCQLTQINFEAAKKVYSALKYNPIYLKQVKGEKK